MPLESWHKSRQAKAKMAKCILHSYVVVSLRMAEVLVKVAWMSPNSQTVADDEIPASSSFQHSFSIFGHRQRSLELRIFRMTWIRFQGPWHGSCAGRHRPKAAERRFAWQEHSR